MRVVSYNIRKAVGLDWKRDGERIVDVLHELNADVVVLQEADKRFGERAGVLPLGRLQGELDYILADHAVRSKSHGWFGNAIFFRKGFSVSAAERIELPTFEPRGAVSIVLETPQVEIIGAHLGLTGRARRQQMMLLGELASKRDFPTLIAGDFNQWRTRPDEFGSGAQIITPGNSFHSSLPMAKLDRFVLFGTVRVTNTFVHKSKSAAKGSDHLPIVIDLEFGDRN